MERETRLQLKTFRPVSEHIDGAWWPRSRSLADELPAWWQRYPNGWDRSR
ncbi:hypothetical protein BZL30_7522 [Mycobacterium kansasii]|uniref:Uncharacterized protein n=1 Tax=Mycobacterium kansasii TaxID=1768 RepID=A0A1V3WKJ1_MYCKA|nr:hypothetical protein BZL30_7522 [Mycobacterium kansasii]